MLRKLIEHEPSTVELIQQPQEPKYKRRKYSSSSEVSSIHKPIGKKAKYNTSLTKQQKVNQSPIPKLPIAVDGINLLNLGRIVVDRSAYHNDNCIYPVGYKISRIYSGQMIVCRVIDNGVTPLFEAFLATDPSRRFSGHSTDDCHAELLQAFENFKMPFVLDGDQFFGFKNDRIRQLIHMLPSAKKLLKIKQEIKQENLSFFDDDNACNYMMTS